MNPSDTASTSHDGRTMMRAVRMEAFGPPDVLTIGVVPAPIAEQGQVVIDVAFANITFVETMFRATGFGPFSGDFWAV